MKFYTVYGNCQGNILALFLNSNPVFKKKFEYIYVRECHLITEREIDYFVKNEAKKIDLFIYTPISDDFRGNYKFSSNYFLSHLRSDCIKISYPSLYYNVYDRQMTYLTDEEDNRVSLPHFYHDKILIKLFMEYRDLTNEEIYKKYIQYINEPNNFDEKELHESILSNYLELKRREQLLENDRRNQFIIKIADFLNENHRKKRFFYTFNHPSKFLYCYMRNQIFKFLDIENNEPDCTPDLDPHSDFISGIFPVVKKQLGIQFEDNTPFPAYNIFYSEYLNYYRNFNIKSLAKIGMYPLRGRFIFFKNWSGDEKTHRWAEASEAEIRIVNDPDSAEESNIFFTIFVIRPQIITIWVNDIQQKKIDFTKGERSAFVHLKVRLSTGENRMEIRSDSPPLSPGGDDLRKLSFSIAKLSVVKESDL
jgi:hypothetical protein